MMASFIQERNFNLRTICSALGRVETKWFKIGVQLGIPRNKLKQFKRDEDDPLSAVVDCCLQGDATEAAEPISWKSIVEALKSEYVGEPGLAEEISKKYYFQQEEAMVEKECKQELMEQIGQQEKRKDKRVASSKHLPETEPQQISQNEKRKDTSGPPAIDQGGSSGSAENEMHPDVKMDLKFILDGHLDALNTRFASYVYCLRTNLEAKGVKPEDLRSFLLSLTAFSSSYEGDMLSLLSDKKLELEKKNTIIEIFDFLITECTSFLNCDIFQKIFENYKIIFDEDQERLQYHDHLKAYIEKHKITEFVKINPLLKSKKGSKELTLKFDIKNTSKLAKIFDLKQFIAKLLKLHPSALELVDIEDGCVVVTFLISSSVADAIFSSDTVFTPHQEEKLRAESVLWLKCNGHTYDFEVKSRRISTAFEKLEEQVTCSVCLGRYTDPKLLLCNHTYCQQCLQGLVQKDQQGQLTLGCPTCRHVTPIPANGVADLQADFRANQLLEIVDEEWKEHATAKPEIASSEEVQRPSSIILTSHEHTTVCCPQHDGKVIELYCETCDENICLKCAVTGGEHHGHNYGELKEVWQRMIQSSLVASLEKAERSLETIERALAQFNAHCDEIFIQRAAIEVEIHNTITVDVKKTELIIQLHQLTQAKLKDLAAQRDLLETIQAQLKRHFLSMRETSNHKEAMLLNITSVKSTLKQVKTLITSIQPGMLKPNMKADMMFSALDEECQENWQVYENGKPDPSYCYITREAGTSSEVVYLHTRNSNNQPCKVSRDSIMCETVSEITGTRARGKVKRRGKSLYEIRGKPTIKGGHQLHIQVEGQHIRESPLPVSATVHVGKLGTPILSIDRVSEPLGVAVNQKGEVVVTEYAGDSVTTFSPSGERLRSFGNFGSDLGQLMSPYGVAVDREENIFVADTLNNRIQKFTAQGKFLKAVGTEGPGPLQFNHPCGIAFNTSNGRVYVADGWNNCIQILNSDLSYYGTFEGGENFYPASITCDGTGNVYVADYDNHRIQVFTAEGESLKMFGVCGEGKGKLKGPFGVAIDSSDRVYVSELNGHRVSVFTSEGRFVTSFGSEGEGPGQFKHPRGIAVDSSGVVYVCDRRNNRLQLF